MTLLNIRKGMTAVHRILLYRKWWSVTSNQIKKTQCTKQRSSKRIILYKYFLCWSIVLQSDNSTLMQCHFDNIKIDTLNASEWLIRFLKYSPFFLAVLMYDHPPQKRNKKSIVTHGTTFFFNCGIISFYCSVAYSSWAVIAQQVGITYKQSVSYLQ